MITVEHDTVINRPMDEVFDFLADATNDPRWCPPVQEVSQVSGNGTGVGTRYTLVTTPGPFRAKGSFEIVDYEKDSRVEFKGSNDIADFHYWYTVEAADGGTRVHMMSKLALKGWRRLLTPIIRSASEQTAEEEFQNLKRILEEGG